MKLFGIKNNEIIDFSKATKVKKGDIIAKAASIELLEKKAGLGTVVDKASLTIKADKEGFVRIGEGKVYVDSLEVIDDNFDMKHGIKSYTSSLWIKGDVLSGSKLFVSGNLQIDGTVENCSIKCNGHLIINGNLYGQEKATIFTKGDIFVRTITSAKVVSYSNIMVNELIRHSTVFSAKSIEVMNRGEIIGGKTYAKNSITAKSIGSSNIIKTEIFLGYNFKLKFILEKLKDELKTTKLRFRKNKEFLEKRFNISLNSDSDFINFVMKNLDHEDEYKNLLLRAIENIKLLEKIRELTLKIKNLSLEHLANLDAYLKCNTIYPGVSIRILDKRIDIINEIKGNLNINRENIDSWQQL